MSATPLLRRLLDVAGGKLDGFLLALDDSTLGDLPDALGSGGRSYPVHRLESELEVRRALHRSGGAPFIGVVPRELAVKLPPDLVRRAHSKRVLALEPVEVLSAVLGHRVTGIRDDEVQDLALEHLDELVRALQQRTVPTVVDRGLLDELLLDVCVGRRVRSEGAGPLLGSWACAAPDWSGPVTRLVQHKLPSLYSDEGRVLAWALDDREVRPRQLLVHGAVLSIDDDEMPETVWGPLADVAPEDLGRLDRPGLRSTLRRLVPEALSTLGDAAGPILDEADGVARQTLPSTRHARSHLLPLGLHNRCGQLARRMAAGEPVAAEEIAWLRSHDAARSRASEIALLDAMARLSRYLSHAATAPPPADASGLVVDYHRHGAFADRAASALQRALAGTGEHHPEARAVLRGWQEARNAANLAFAEALASGYDRALHQDLVPLHRVVRQVIAPALRGKASKVPVPEPGVTAGLYLVVLDGCSLPVFLDLVHDLQSDPGTPFGLASFGDQPVGSFHALAPLPTITSHARGALFLGEIPTDPLIPESRWREESEGTTDPTRFRRNDSLAEVGRRLFLKGDLSDGGATLRETLARPEVALVAAVFNAVDDQIGSRNTGVPLRIAPREIAGLVPSLVAAAEAGRRILVVSDHGFSPFLSKELRVGAGSTTRYVELDTGEDPPDGFLEIPLQDLGGSIGRCAFAWRMGAYRGQPQVGFHGGASLEEMAVPLAWIVPRGLPADAPAWWFDREAGAVAREADQVPTVRAAAPREPVVAAAQSSPAQLGMFAGPEPLSPERLAALDLPDDLLASLSEDQQRALLALADNQSVRAGELARLLGKPVGRIGGFMSKLHRRLARAGSARFSTEELPGGEPQYRYAADKEEP